MAHNSGKFTVMGADYFLLGLLLQIVKPAEVGVHAKADRKWPFVF